MRMLVMALMTGVLFTAGTAAALTCATVTCGKGMACKTVDGKPKCVAKDKDKDSGKDSDPLGHGPTCVTLTCEHGYECKTDKDGKANCVKIKSGGGGALGGLALLSLLGLGFYRRARPSSSCRIS